MLLNNHISIAYFIRHIRTDIAIIIVYATLAGVLDQYSMLRSISIPLSVSAIVGTLISLLLAFRTSQSYERWWEARMVWGAIVNDSRTLIRQLIQFLPRTAETEKFVQDFAQRQIIWCYTLSEALRKVPHSAKVESYFQIHHPGETTNRPNLLLSLHAAALQQITAAVQLDPNRQVQIDATLARLTDAMGKCERIKNTIFPKAYSLLLHSLIYVFLTIFPFGLEDQFPLTEVFLTVLIPVLFISIEQTAIIMQDPFEHKPTDTPMTAISNTIQANLCEMAGLPPGAPEPAQMSYYTM